MREQKQFVTGTLEGLALATHRKLLAHTLLVGTLAAGAVVQGSGQITDSRDGIEPTASATAGNHRLDRIIRDDRVRESSGIVQSTYRRRTLFTHNDSGDGPRFFAIGSAGKTRGVFTLRNAAARDWEDVAEGPNHSLWFGDIGDNARARKDVTVYKVKEPRTLTSRKVRRARYQFAYRDGAHDAESLLVRPRTGRLFIATKSRTGGAALYRAPKQLSRSSVNRLTRVGYATTAVTSGAFFPGGRRYVLRNHNWAFIYSQVGDKHPRKVRLPDRGQGESIDVTRSGRALIAGSEGRQSPVDRVTLR